ncbi:hypothetical protein EDB89DRAFT_268443 [Lactarius sanguifluus]|nr:hypothetical protein EDB89DRAFT_268443 [Lactarius sanguifluus]
MDSPLLSPTSAGPLNTASTQPYTHPSNFRIGFITPLFRDPRHRPLARTRVHLSRRPVRLISWHCYCLVRYRRPHCRDPRMSIKQPRQVWIRIDLVPDAGARAGTANGRETTLASLDIEEGKTMPSGSLS